MGLGIRSAKWNCLTLFGTAGGLFWSATEQRSRNLQICADSADRTSVVQTAAGDAVGKVAAVEGGAGATHLVMNGPRGEILIPLAVDICVEIDIANKRIRIDPPEGLLELNETKGAGGRRQGAGKR